MEIQQYILLGLIISLASALQSAIGFGYALFATPLLVWIGIPLPSVITLVSTCSLFQSLFGVIDLRHHVPWRLSLIATPMRIVGLIIGILMLRVLVGLSIMHIRMVIGCVLCAMIILQLLYHPAPRQHLHWAWGGLAFTGSGVLSGLCGMGGPPLVFWVMAHDWGSHKSRAFLFATFTAGIPVQLILLGISFGKSIVENFVLALLLTPIVYIGSMLGLAIGNRISKNLLRRLVYALLLFIAVSAIVTPFLSRQS
jgi:uncharacterized membrane protein YfcA